MRTQLLLFGSALLAGCGSKDQTPCTVDTSYQPTIDPAHFSATVDNPLFPLATGTHYTFEGGGEVNDVIVTSDTRTIVGVTCVVVHDTIMVDGQLTEDTLDYFAQDQDGNVWYFGEDTKEYENGQVSSTEGSWEAGVDGAQPGIIMAADPQVDGAYRQEYYACQAEDMAEVVATDESVTVPAGTYQHCVETHDFTPLEPDVNEHKFYCPGVGVALEVEGDVRNELVGIAAP